MPRYGSQSKKKITPRLVSRDDYDFGQWSVVSIVIKKLFVYFFTVNSHIDVLHANIFSPFMIWNKFTDFFIFSNFLLTLHAR